MIFFDINNQSTGSISNANKLSYDKTESNAPQLNNRISIIESNQSSHEKTKIPVNVKNFNEQPTQTRPIITSLPK